MVPLTIRQLRPERLARGARAARERGNALVEFTLVLIPFIFLLMAMVDLGRGIYTYNAVSQAAREMARAMSSHDECCDTGSSLEAQEVRDAQLAAVPGLAADDILIACVDVTGSPSGDCQAGDYVEVSVSVDFELITPLFNVAGPIELSSVSRQQYT